MAYIILIMIIHNSDDLVIISSNEYWYIHVSTNNIIHMYQIRSYIHTYVYFDVIHNRSRLIDYFLFII